MKIKLFILEVPIEEFNKKCSLGDLEFACSLGSGPKKEGTEVEGMVVPQGKVWLFPLGGDFERVERFVTGERKTIKVEA